MKTDVSETNRKATKMKVIIYKTRKPEMVDYMKTRLKDMKIEEVRGRLSKIKGSLADDIIKHRE